MGDTYYAQLAQAWDPTLAWRGRRLRILTSLRILRHARGTTLVVSNETNRSPLGLAVTALGLRLLRRRVLVLTEFLPGRRGRVLSWLYRHTLPHACRAVQVMTEHEARAYRSWYGLRPEQVRVIPYFSFDDRPGDAPEAPPAAPGGYLMSTGRNSCDWETVAALSRRVDHPFELVCTDADLPRLGDVGRRTRVRHEIPRAEHDALLDRADALLLVLEDRPRSMGHVRLMSAVSRGVPVIASEVEGLRGYEHLVYALVPPGSVEALVGAVDVLLADPGAARERAAQIRDLARAYPRSLYVERLRELFTEAAAQGAAAS